ncbi:hypothetical protein [Flavobacterium sp. 28YEA47A]|uniref:hypothetical protein n=1 Tax=Flavobacterium sp. 28YEA47A TaxID=3156276 RepID=UPI00351309C5
MTSSVNELFISPLVKKYGEENVVWPIVLIKNKTSNSYLYEKSEHCSINSPDDNRPTSASGKKSIFLDYSVKENRHIIPDTPELNVLTGKEFSCSYDCILNNEEIVSVDIDYVWNTGDKWKAIELTTLWMPLKSEEEAIRLVKMFTRRPSWNGPHGPHGIRTLIDASNDLGLEYWMICVNSEKGVSNNLVVDGNACGFPLTHDNIDRILRQNTPEDFRFGSFNKLIEWL